MSELKIYFSDFFGVDEEIIESYGAVNISLINDMPLFVDPFLLFNSDKEEYQNIHNEIITYLIFLQSQAEIYPMPPEGMLKSWYCFSEIKQNWLGFSEDGNSGRGLGLDFAKNLHKGLQTVYKDFGKEEITKSSHLEKLCLISPKVGRDKISDFTINFAKKYILEYTEAFAKKYLASSQCREFSVAKVEFNYSTGTWKTKRYFLPSYNGDYVLLTPRDLLTRDDTFINRVDMINNLENIAPSIEDASLRFELNQYFRDVLRKKKKEMSKTEKERKATELIYFNPQIIDYYIKYKEDMKEEATSISQQVVGEVRQLFNYQLQDLARLLQTQTAFYDIAPNSYDESYRRVLFLKSVIEDMDGYRLFYIDGKPIKRENDLQIMYRLVWYATDFDVNREVNNGRGPADFKISKGVHNATLVEFKLASNSKLKINLQNQAEIYQKASGANRTIKVILYFTEDEYIKTQKILKEIGLDNCKDIVLINAIGNKPSASNATSIND